MVRKRPSKYRYLSWIVGKFSLFWDWREALIILEMPPPPVLTKISMYYIHISRASLRFEKGKILIFEDLSVDSVLKLSKVVKVNSLFNSMYIFRTEVKPMILSPPPLVCFVVINPQRKCGLFCFTNFPIVLPPPLTSLSTTGLICMS